MLLLPDELALLKELASKVEHLEFETLDEEAIKAKLLPLFDDLLLSRLQSKDTHTIEIFSRYLAQIIAKSATNDPKALGHALQSVISPVIAQEIADNKEKMIDALYPIMGGMISKYVTNAIKEMMEHINAKIEDGLSIERYKRKIKSKLTGVSETELLLEESAEAQIKALFVIQKDTGLLIAAAQQGEKEIDDPHIVASMASAIKDFVNDWMKNTKQSQEVQLLSYGNATLYIESAGSVYMIAFLDAEPDYDQRTKIQHFFAKVVKHYSDFFQTFKGDNTAEEITQLQQKMLSFLESENAHTPKQTAPTKGSPAKIIGIALLLGLLGYGGYIAKKAYRYHQLETQIAKRTGEKITIVEASDGVHLQGSLHTVENIPKIHAVLKEQGYTKTVNELYLPAQEVEAQMRTLKMQNGIFANRLNAFDTNLSRFQEKLAKQIECKLNETITDLNKTVETLSQKETALEKTYLQTKKKLNTAATIAHLKHYAVARLSKHFGKRKSFYPKNGVLDFANTNLFEAGETEPNPKTLPAFDKDVLRYIQTLMDDATIRPYIKHFMIESFTDSSGSHALNEKLSRQRAEKIAQHLQTLPQIEQYGISHLFTAHGRAESDPIIINGIEDKEASRRIRIRFILDEKKILQSLQKVLKIKLLFKPNTL
ncbi:Putative periplasmic protein [hydrothermal vent metagenome]|uniref:Putative periplasmic protein n=1 Tax=hydrothermal vent metagenome TaxID=652676 RepID=A0A1W1E906_9ZZZZ